MIVKALLPATTIDMGGMPVKQALPTQQIGQVDPFLLLHHGTFTTTDLAPAKQQGLGPHPHRGFSPVTFVIDGEVHHRDSRGNSQVASAGEVQWMHAGAGIIHSERPSQALVERKGSQEIVQLWINSPKAFKMVEPLYQYVAKEQIPVVASEDEKVQTKAIAGEWNAIKGKIKTNSPLLVLWGNADPDGTETYTVPEGYSVLLYLIKGDVRLKDYGKVEAEHLVVFEENTRSFELTALSVASFLVLAGRPLNEKVVQQGPFVMNSETEILEAMRDYQMGKMGFLIEE